MRPHSQWAEVGARPTSYRRDGGGDNGACARACGGGASCSTSPPSTASTRWFATAASSPDASVQAFHNAQPRDPGGAVLPLVPRVVGTAPLLPVGQVVPLVLERLLRLVALHRHRRRHRVALPPRPGALPVVAQHAGLHHRPRLDRLRVLPADAAAAAAGRTTTSSTRSEVVGGLWSFDSGTMQKISNQYAAMPSLHFGWSSWSALVLFPLVRRRW